MATFTKQQLFQVRNEIDIDYLISDKLNLERQFDGMWHFAAPYVSNLIRRLRRKPI